MTRREFEPPLATIKPEKEQNKNMTSAVMTQSARHHINTQMRVAVQNPTKSPQRKI